jgi:hypothetical protein
MRDGPPDSKHEGDGYEEPVRLAGTTWSMGAHHIHLAHRRLPQNPIQLVQPGFIFSLPGQSQSPREPRRDRPDPLPLPHDLVLQLFGNPRTRILQPSWPERHIPSFPTYEALAWPRCAIERGRRQTCGWPGIGSLAQMLGSVDSIVRHQARRNDTSVYPVTLPSSPVRMNERLVGCGDGSCLISEGIESSFCQCLITTPSISRRHSCLSYKLDTPQQEKNWATHSHLILG